jgi:ADP-ribosyl-[dinitrogen reductase] hydrolase
MTKDKDRFTGILVGLGVGDALGTTLEFGPRRPLNNPHTEMIGGGVFDLEPGQWTDDTAMALAMGRSLLQEKAYQPLKILKEWIDWHRHGKHSCNGTCFDIGNATRSALNAFLRNPTAMPKIPPSQLGNGTLMRLAPVVLFASDKDEAESLSYQQSPFGQNIHAARL